MTIELSDEQRHFIQQEIAKGRYADETALVGAALELLRQREAWVERVVAGVDRGRKDIAEGRSIEVNGPEDARRLREEVRRRARERLERGGPTPP